MNDETDTRDEAIRSVTPPAVCLTFDDGPDPYYTPRVLDVLAAEGVRASFFVLGKPAARWPRLVERMRRDGHVVASHGYSHRHPWRMGTHAVCRELWRTEQTILQITGQRPRWFRPPHGRFSPALSRQLSTLGMRPVLWSRSAVDWGPLASEAAVGRRLLDTEAGDIVLMHDARQQINRPDITLEVLPRLIANLRQKGLVPMTLDEALGESRDGRQTMEPHRPAAAQSSGSAADPYHLPDHRGAGGQRHQRPPASG